METWVETHRKEVMIGVALLVLGVLGFVGYRYLILQPQEEEARLFFSYPERYLLQDSLYLALEGDGVNPGFLELAEDYRKTGPGKVAGLYAGALLLREGRFDEAIEILENIRFPHDPYLEQRRLNLLADAYSETGEIDRAIETYLEGADLNTRMFSAHLLWRAGILAERSGKLDQAQEIYERLLREYPRTEEGQRAEQYLARVQAKLGKPLIEVP